MCLCVYLRFYSVWLHLLRNKLYIGCSDVTESIVMTRSPFCGYNTISCVELNGEDLSCYSNKIESVSLSKCPDWPTKRI